MGHQVAGGEAVRMAIHYHDGRRKILCGQGAATLVTTKDWHRVTCAKCRRIVAWRNQRRPLKGTK